MVLRGKVFAAHDLCDELGIRRNVVGPIGFLKELEPVVEDPECGQQFGRQGKDEDGKACQEPKNKGGRSPHDPPKRPPQSPPAFKKRALQMPHGQHKQRQRQEQERPKEVRTKRNDDLRQQTERAEKLDRP